MSGNDGCYDMDETSPAGADQSMVGQEAWTMLFSLPILGELPILGKVSKSWFGRIGTEVKMRVVVGA